MAYPKAITDKAFAILAQRRSDARSDYQQRLQLIEQKLPAVAELQRELTGTSAAIAKAVLGGGDVQAKLDRLKENNLAMQQRKRELFLAAGLPGDYDQMHFACPLCSDTGYYQGKMCHCLKQLLSRLMLESLTRSANLSSLTTFADFKLDYYSPVKLDGLNVSPRELMSRALAQCRDFADRFSPTASPSMFFQGATGLGKTHLSLAIAAQVAQNGWHVLYLPAQLLIDRLERERFRRSEDGLSIDYILDADLLILDDLGTEFSNSFSVSALYNVINSRLVEQRPTIISSNLTLKELEQRYSQRLVSRIVGGYHTIPFKGSDIRLQRRS